MASRRLILIAAVLAVALSIAPAQAANEGRIATLESIVVDEVVEGDVVSIAGDIELRPGADIQGHVVAIFGSVTQAEGARVEGRVLAVSSLASLTLEPVSGSQRSALALRLLAVGGWLTATTLLALFLPLRLRHGVRITSALGLRVLVLGATAFVTLIAALVAVLGLGTGVGVPLAVMVMIVFLGLKAIGLAVLGASLGSGLLTRLTERRFPLTAAVFVGVLLMVALRFLPIIGGFAWTALSVAALGAGILALAVVPSREEARVPVRSSESTPR